MNAQPLPDTDGQTVRTTCPYCGVGCGVLATSTSNGDTIITGDPDHPANFGRLCSKGSALAETISEDGRLLHPEIAGRTVSWNEALDFVASGFADTIAKHGRDSVAFYVSGQLLTEDYYVANKLMKGFIGTANIDTNSRLCMASSVAGHRRAFGSDTVPGMYEDLEEADAVILVGSNFAWCHPVLFQRLQAAREKRGTQVVVIDPRETATASDSDLHLALKPGTDVALFNGLLRYLAANGAADDPFVSEYTNNVDAALTIAEPFGISRTATDTGLDPILIRRFFELVCSTQRLVTVYSQGVNQSATGTDKVNAIINCHLLTGRIGKPGAGPFSITGQPNAMGGREVGGLANQLAAHMALDDPNHRQIVQAAWGAPRIADTDGLKAVEMFDAVKDGRIKAIWIMATNPVDSMPNADAVRDALAGCPLVVLSDIVGNTDTAACADVLLPAAAWGEKDGTVTNSERRISRQRRFMTPPGEARADWWIISEVGRRMGYPEAFSYSGPADILREYAALTATGNHGTRDLDLGALASLSNAEYEQLGPVQWPLPVGGDQGGRMFSAGGFYTPDRRARFVATPVADRGPEDKKFPLVLNTGRVRDHWHTMTRTGRSSRLSAHIAEPFVEIHPSDAARSGVKPAEVVIVESREGSVLARALISEGQQEGTVFVPMHWTNKFSARARVDALVAPTTDPISGQPALKSGRIRIKPFKASWYAFAVVRHLAEDPPADYWTVAKSKGGFRIEMAGTELPLSWSNWASTFLGAPSSTPGLSVEDARMGIYRSASFDGDDLVGAVFVAREPVVVDRSLAARGLSDRLDESERIGFLAGRSGQGQQDRGAIVCSCFEVGVNQITDAVLNRQCLTIEAIGGALQAGTNCGSCRPEIRRLIESSDSPPAHHALSERNVA